MSDKTSGTATPVCDHLRATGSWNPAWDPIAELDPAWTEKFMAMGAHTVMSGVLEPKVLEFIAIAVDASCTHMYAPGTRRHIRKALELGATRAEIAAVLQAVSVLGIHTSSLGAPILLEELAAIEQARTTTTRAAA
ncbi:carboxymuconolactone decarboxylase family protein [Cupriavidus lacunae]|uniref:Carboxymuconolactone decarboxylase family protein n=1 Tax=Cupriavidus lacunae TaxID=2666307 RepID=A0A370NNP4_9BURK|nr:carboxymuconolactone decarboxylase family protein [Cupriavidus lacunae]RDK07235.1 carboxymuconolactone decarboxylase family protein [Cupriavidus lacunae]